MSLPPKLKQKYLDRLDELIRRGEGIEVRRETKTVRRGTRYAALGREPTYDDVETTNVDMEAYSPWKSSCVTIFEQVLPKGGIHEEWVKAANSARAPDGIAWILARLRSVREDLDLGFLDNLGEKIEGEIASNYMEQAETLLGECQAASFSYVPAAVLAGTVLERHLRELCAKQTPPIDTIAPGGKAKTLDPLITDLAKAAVLTAPQAALLRGFAAIRNKAAHGEWDQITRAQVESMVQGVKSTLAFTAP